MAFKRQQSIAAGDPEFNRRNPLMPELVRQLGRVEQTMPVPRSLDGVVVELPWILQKIQTLVEKTQQVIAQWGASSKDAAQFAKHYQSDIPRMNPWNGANASILPGSGEAMGGLRSFPGASAASDVGSNL